MKNLLPILFLFCALSANAVDRITATISFTNTPANLDTITVNGVARTWKTTVATVATEIAVTNSAANSATNYYQQVIANQYAAPLVITYQNATNIQLVANSGNALSVSASGTYATITLATQVVASASALNLPLSGEPTAWIRTNKGSQALTAINDYATNSFAAGIPALSNYASLTLAQEFTGAKTFSGANTYSNATQLFSGGTITNAGLTNITYFSGSNGIIYALITVNQVMTNGQNYGEPFRSPGAGANSEQFGAGALATGDASTAFGSAANAISAGATAIGQDTAANGNSSIAVGREAVASGAASLAIGPDTISSATYSIALGSGANAGHAQSAAIGASALTTTTNQIRLGTATENVSIPGGLNVEGVTTNIHLAGTNTIDGSISEKRHEATGLIAGNNVINSGTNGYLNLQGSGNANICAINDAYDGKILTLRNTNSWSMVIVNNSGFDGSTTTNRIFTGENGNLTITNRPGFVRLRYDLGDGSWNVESHSN